MSGQHTREILAELGCSHRTEGWLARGIVAALEKTGRQHEVVFIAHELTEDTRRALVNGTIDILINQDAGHEIRSAIRVLMASADKSPIVEAMERIRIDIFIRDNIP